MTRRVAIELDVPGRLTPRAIVAAARGLGFVLPPCSLDVIVFIDAHGLPYPPAYSLRDLKAVFDGLMLASLIVDQFCVTHIDFRTTATLTEPRALIRIRSLREDHP